MSESSSADLRKVGESILQQDKRKSLLAEAPDLVKRAIALKWMSYPELSCTVKISKAVIPEPLREQLIENAKQRVRRWDRERKRRNRAKQRQESACP
jgi:hypothetical protein